jgi:hypothetical protein
MTEPVIARGEPTDLSSPVINSDEAGAFTMAFVMPPGRTRSTLPRPDDPRVELVQVPGRRVIAMRFHGHHSAGRVAAYQRDLINLVAGAGFTVRGAPSFAGYDPATTLPLLRRNEVLIEIA